MTRFQLQRKGILVATGTREQRPAFPLGLGAGSLAARRDTRHGARLGSSYFLILALVGTLLAVGLVLVLVLPVMLALALLVLAEPDLGTTMLLCVIGFAMLFLAGTPLRVLGAVSLVGLLGGLTMRGYQRARLTAFLDPAGD